MQWNIAASPAAGAGSRAAQTRAPSALCRAAALRCAPLRPAPAPQAHSLFVPDSAVLNARRKLRREPPPRPSAPARQPERPLPLSSRRRRHRRRAELPTRARRAHCACAPGARAQGVSRPQGCSAPGFPGDLQQERVGEPAGPWCTVPPNRQGSRQHRALWRKADCERRGWREGGEGGEAAWRAQSNFGVLVLLKSLSLLFAPLPQNNFLFRGHAGPPQAYLARAAGARAARIGGWGARHCAPAQSLGCPPPRGHRLQAL
jgi:hypothetical protein